MLLFGAECFVFQVVIKIFKDKIYRNIILPVDVYGYQTWSLIFREEKNPRVFENMVGRENGGLEETHNEELNDLYSYPKL